MQEGEELAEDGDAVVIREVEGTEGQQFQENLIDHLLDSWIRQLESDVRH
jgi:hypothetical protein